MSPGYQATQAAHAVADLAVIHPQQVAEWHSNSNTIVILTVKDEFALQRFWYDKIMYQPVATTFYEPDIDDELTAIAVLPTDGAAVLMSALSRLPLALRSESDPRYQREQELRRCLYSTTEGGERPQ